MTDRLSRTRTLPPRAILLAVVCTLLWGSAIPCVKISYALFQIRSAFDQIFFAGIRFFLAGIVTLLLAHRFSPAVQPLRARRMVSFLGLGLVQTAGQYVFFYLGLSHTPGARTAILNATSTFFIVFLAAVFFREERLTPRKLLGCAVGFLGILCMNLGGESGLPFSWNGDFFILMASAFFALGSVLSKRLSRTDDAFRISGNQLLFGGGALVLVGLVGGGRLAVVTPAGVAILGYLVALSAIAFALWTRLMQRYEAASVSIYFFLLPVFGVAFSALLLGERVLSLRTLLALLLVCGGIYLVNSVQNAPASGDTPSRS
ncbi:hypothetical protein SDC9_70747 [bioreactor metagenome]|uniref:EamA domain-containing protein n=1 Tax=bioreactor metagenome TaxID=1076179 RepID=A0A644Y6S7_9ZZZZ|nr:DMT family transporter [Christensenella sp.]